MKAAVHSIVAFIFGKRFPKAAALGGGGAQHRPYTPSPLGRGQGVGRCLQELTISLVLQILP